MDDHKRLYTLLQMIRLLSESGGYPVDRLARRFKVTSRSIYRYFRLLRECGFDLEKKGGRYLFRRKDHADNLLPLLTNDEATLLRDAVLAMHPSHPQKTGLLKKLELLSDPQQLSELIVDAALSEVTGKLALAIRENKMVILHGYHSPNSDTVRDRLVEPLGFSVNMRYLYAFDPGQDMVRQFKPERITRVEITKKDRLSESSARVRNIIERYRTHKPDLFGMNGEPRCAVRLRLNRRAAHLLLEEYPESAILGVGKKNHRHSDEQDDSHEVVDIPVNGFEGAGRFVLGLPGEAEPVSPPAFLRYLKTRMSRSNLTYHQKKVQDI